MLLVQLAYLLLVLCILSQGVAFIGPSRLNGHLRLQSRPSSTRAAAIGSSSSSSENSAHKPYTHSIESKRKISEANKGRVPWNLGRHHSEETKALISLGNRAAARMHRVAHAASLGMTLDELVAHNEAQRTKKRVSVKRERLGLTREGRKRISDSLKKRWQDPYYRQLYSCAINGSRAHSDQTRKKISVAIKEKWKDSVYRSKLVGRAVEPEVRESISKTLKARWRDPLFREKMLPSLVAQRSDEWRRKIAVGVRRKWADPSYRTAVMTGRGSVTGSSRDRVKSRVRSREWEKEVDEAKVRSRTRDVFGNRVGHVSDINADSISATIEEDDRHSNSRRYDVQVEAEVEDVIEDTIEVYDSNGDMVGTVIPDSLEYRQLQLRAREREIALRNI
jgi:hypothetical protein